MTTQVWKDYEMVHNFVHGDEDPFKEWFIRANESRPEFRPYFIESWDGVMDVVKRCVRHGMNTDDLEWDGSIKDTYLTCVDFIRNGNKPKDTIELSWSIDDVLGLDDAKENNLTKDEAREVLSMADNNHDACHGVSWDTLDVYIGMVVEDRL